MRTDGHTLGVEAALLATGHRVCVAGGCSLVDQAHGLQVAVDVAQDLVVALARIAQHLADPEAREAATQVLQARDGLQMVVAVGGYIGAEQRPESEQAVIQHVAGLALVAEVVLATARLALLHALRRRGVAVLVGAAVVHVSGFGVTRGSQPAMFLASVGVAGTALLALCLGGAVAFSGRLEAGSVHVPAAHVRTSAHQLTVQGDADTALGRVVGKGRLAGDQAVGQQAERQAVGALHNPGERGGIEGHAEGRDAGQVVGLEAQATPITLPPFQRVQLSHQLRPTPAAPQRQEPGQPQTDRIEGRWTELASETLAQDRPPGTEACPELVEGSNSRRTRSKSSSSCQAANLSPSRSSGASHW